MIEIEKNIPFPDSFDKYPFAKMEIGDSIFVPAGEKGLTKIYNSANASACVARKKLAPKEFILRRFEGGVRIWRTK